MQAIELFSGLPTSLSCNILRDWLTLKSVMALDSAYCCHCHREIIFNLMQSDECIIIETIRIGPEVSVSTVLLKYGQKLRSVAIEQRLSPAEVNFVATHCQSLTRMHIESLECCTSELWNLLHENRTLESVSLSTRRIHYSGPPSNFLSFADVQTVSFRLVDEDDGDGFIHDDNWREVLNMSKNVIRLDLYCTIVSYATLLQLPLLCPHLTSLGLRNSDLTDTVLHTITKSLPHIVNLDISSNYRLSEAAIMTSLQNLTGLRSLRIYNVRDITCATIRHLYRHCADTLHTLYIACSDSNIPSAMGKLLRRCTQLRTLSIETNWNRERDLSNMFQPCTLSRLTTLIFDCSDFSEEYIVSVGRYGVNLEVLSLYALSCCSSRSFLSLYKGCPKLKRLYIDLEEDGDPLKNPHIREFNLFALTLWQEHRPGLEIIQSAPYDLNYDVMKM